ncbi:hypothetical protein DB811_20425 [Xanthomonas perforans]|uniref:Uncharacterized protein n=2 Tax=Xanthomonas perforans TaxID=442694 RepID=A0AAQ0YMC8_XANPE|nr:hypothetical protein XPE_13635 [Xanthomonas perforans 91-118]RXD34641.1 hypothetical protein DB854_15910 [Xanthomonas perforans]RXD38619.1 hypothetical protein DB757_17050 [Xanthomonas perforans]RXD48201.1 hypothetical protein DB761_01810 [Xanthomonas perforans]RXD49551.1 hypothetical protein DB769_20845 [Xanthomonas perforans]
MATARRAICWGWRSRWNIWAARRFKAMSTSGPERRQLHYFADYEGYCDGRPVLWGQLAHSVDVPADGELDAATLVRALRRRAAEAHGLEAGQIRLCQVTRL